MCRLREEVQDGIRTPYCEPVNDYSKRIHLYGQIMKKYSTKTAPAAPTKICLSGVHVTCIVMYAETGYRV